MGGEAKLAEGVRRGGQASLLSHEYKEGWRGAAEIMHAWSMYMKG